MYLGLNHLSTASLPLVLYVISSALVSYVYSRSLPVYTATLDLFSIDISPPSHAFYAEVLPAPTALSDHSRARLWLFPRSNMGELSVSPGLGTSTTFLTRIIWLVECCCEVHTTH